MSAIPFVKYSGCGNDFVIFDLRLHSFPLQDPAIVKRLCHRTLGIGADGVLFIEKSSDSDYRMRIFNCDGSEAEMCGNGMRCIGHFLAETDSRERFSIVCFEKHYTIQVEGSTILVKMPPPQILDMEIEVQHENKTLQMAFIDTGVPHVVLFTEALAQIPLEKIGPYLRYHPRFGQKGTNVNFACFEKNGRLSVRTYERGVENETFACGTGCAAVATAARKKFGLKNPIQTITGTREILSFEFQEETSHIESMIMGGPAQKIFSGQIEAEKLLNPTLFS